MRYLKTWSIFESNDQGWPANWKDLPEWKILSDMGFSGEDTKNGNISLSSPYYGTLVLTKNRYIRRPGVNGYMESFRIETELSHMFIRLAVKLRNKFRDFSKERGQTSKDLETLKVIDSLGGSIPRFPGLSEDEVLTLIRTVRGKWKIDKDGLIEVEGDISRKKSSDIYKKKIILSKILPNLKFGKITGDVYLPNFSLSSLPQFLGPVGGFFNCSGNPLKSLRGAPKKVGKYFNCSKNELQSLEGGPQEVGWDFYCHGNPLQSLDGAPSEYKTIWWSERGSNFIVPPFERAIEKESMLVYSIFNNPEAMDKLVDFIKKDLDNAPRILSIIRKNNPEFYERFKRRAEDMGVTIDTSADLGDLGF